jgi:uncharacterized protein (TIGR03118 family)
MRCSTVATALVAVFISYLGTPAAVKAGGYVEKDLVADVKPLTDKNGIVHNDKDTILDPHLVNPWGIAESPTSPFWVSDNGAGVATLYTVPGANNTPVSINGLVVSIPTPVDLTGSGGTPTGAVFNIALGAGAFKITDGTHTAPAVFLFVTEDGTIVGWNPGVDPTGKFDGPNGVSTHGVIAVDNSGNNFTNPNPSSQTGAVYKGLAIATDAKGQTRLYATNFRSGKVEMYKDDFMALGSGPAFVDPKLPDSYAPFNVTVLNGAVFVTYAVQDAAKHDDVAGQGHGIVDVFELDGTFHQRFAQHGQLNSPWGVAVAPANFGPLAGKLWIGNFGNGHINAFDPESGEFLDKVRDPNGQAIVIDGLWALRVGNGRNGGLANTIYFTAGPNDEKDGLFGSLTPKP